LILFSLLYLLGLFLRKIFYKTGIFFSQRLPCKVISVGNISWGGTGKTPLVELLAQRLKEKGYKVAVLTYGYKSEDETILLKQRLADIPVLVGKDRLKNAQEAINRQGAQVLILDDGFQYWRMKRDLDIVAINSLNPFGDKRVLPAGILREPLSCLKRADIFVLTKSGIVLSQADLEGLLSHLNPRALLVHSVYQIEEITNQQGDTVNLVDLKGKSCAALCAIAEPESFEKMLVALGINISLKLRFIDHHEYSPEDIKYIQESCARHNVSIIITTEKDAVKLKKYPIEYFVCKIKAKVSEDEAFFRRVFDIF